MSIDTTNMTASQIANLRDEKEKELLKAQEVLSAVEQAELELGKQIILKQAERKDLQVAISKGKQNVRILALDVRLLTTKFFDAKDHR